MKNYIIYVCIQKKIAWSLDIMYIRYKRKMMNYRVKVCIDGDDKRIVTVIDDAGKREWEERGKELGVRSEDRETNRWEIPFQDYQCLAWIRLNTYEPFPLAPSSIVSTRRPVITRVFLTPFQRPPKTLHRFALRDLVLFDRVKFTSRFHDFFFNLVSFDLFTSSFLFPFLKMLWISLTMIKYYEILRGVKYILEICRIFFFFFFGI